MNIPKKKQILTNKNQLIGSFSLALTFILSWHSLRSFRLSMLDKTQSSTGRDLSSDLDLLMSTPSNVEIGLLVVSILFVLYGLFELVLWISTGKTIDEEMLIDSSVSSIDVTFEEKTKKILWALIIGGFVIFIGYLFIKFF